MDQENERAYPNVIDVLLENERKVLFELCSTRIK